ncbi:regulatory-associated protein of TOR 1-like isoform X2 [Hibiscus syriacus]|uniref:regulatory-associated protein of TOR 1-like isoform X2 n=1 Tax=Hibiscus syriacus TaxID=106335 RepID=UPI00192440DF|nr:regulatory-associated protein of TOR 1-like isoform X2 [Hibiscus syriacus]
MAMAYLMTSQFAQLSLAVSNHVTDGNGSFGDYHEVAASADLASQMRDLILHPLEIFGFGKFIQPGASRTSYCIFFNSRSQTWCAEFECCCGLAEAVWISICIWREIIHLDKEQVVNSIPSSSDCNVSALASSQVHAGQFAAGFFYGSIRLYDIRTPDMLVRATRPHSQQVERVVGIGFQPGLDRGKIVSASQAGDIQFLDIRNQRDTYLTINAHKVFSLEGEQLGIIRYQHTFMTQKIDSVSCLTYHPYQVLLAAGAADACVSIYADGSSQTR